MLVSIIVINYNTFQLTCNCIASVIQYTKEIDYEIILVDNNSTECNPDLFLKKFPGITLVKKLIPNELEVMREINKNKVYYYLLSAIYQCKERSRYLIKLIAFKLSGKIIR